jgi:4-hydroxythreonine-4-phosphate dehydrogenase
VALVTIHIPISQVASQITTEKVERAIRLALQSCVQLGLPRSRVGVCGLNPHAGEGGEIGREEIEVIRPVVESFQKQGHDVIGPQAADALFHFAYKGHYDVVVCMYHDQGLVPLKMVAFERGINWTLGLPFIRTSPDHGTAYDIAGRGIADEKSMISAIELAMQLVVRNQR